MGEAREDGGVADALLSSPSRNVFKQFIPEKPEFAEPAGWVDLSLGLSVGGSGGKSSTREKSLLRSFSVSGTLSDPSWRNGYLSLARAVSVPLKPAMPRQLVIQAVKEMQADKRREAKARLKVIKNKKKSKQSANLPAKSASRKTRFCCAIGKLKSDGTPPANLKIQGQESSTVVKLPALNQTSRVMGKGKSVDAASSYGSKRGLSLGTMANRKPAYSANSHSAIAVTTERRATGKQVKPLNDHHPGSVGSSKARANVKPVEPAEPKLERSSMEMKTLSDGYHKVATMELMKQMPGVTTSGDGPNGRKIEGILYRYKDHEVVIVCVCHGKFLSPEEFIKHAGGTIVDNPMKRINVLPPKL